MARIALGLDFRVESITGFVDEGKQNICTNDDSEHDADSLKAEDESIKEKTPSQSLRQDRRQEQSVAGNREPGQPDHDSSFSQHMKRSFHHLCTYPWM
jgi:hypothetical protein